MDSRNSPAEGLALDEVRVEPSAPRSRLRAYVAVLCLTPVVLLAAAARWMASPVYREHAQYTSFTGIGYGTRLQHADCEVVIDGDSSALVGVIPAVVEQKTGLKTCNVAEMAGVRVVNGGMVLDEYLAHNRAPRLIVFQFAPNDFVPAERWKSVATFEGVYFRLQYRPDAAFVGWSLTHPEMLLDNLELGARTGLPWIREKPLPPEAFFVRERHGGWLPDEGTALTACPHAPGFRPPDAAYVAEMRAKYQTQGTKVLMESTPEPECLSDRALYAPLLARVTDAPAATLPLGDYTDSGWLHVNRAGAEANSERVAELVQAALKEGR